MSSTPHPPLPPLVLSFADTTSNFCSTCPGTLGILTGLCPCLGPLEGLERDGKVHHQLRRRVHLKIGTMVLLLLRLSCFVGILIMESSNITRHVHCSISRYELELKPTGEVEQYSASATYNLQGEGKAWVDSLKFVIQAEGRYPEKGSSISALRRRSRTHENILKVMCITNRYGGLISVRPILRVEARTVSSEDSPCPHGLCSKQVSI